MVRFESYNIVRFEKNFYFWKS